nr:MAG TPA: hypothetical protein [Caudoviricetes sp.]
MSNVLVKLVTEEYLTSTIYNPFLEVFSAIDQNE